MGLIKKLWDWWFSLNRPIRFILVGGYNTVVGYLLFALCHFFFAPKLPDFAVLLLSYLIGIFQNFIVFRIFVFQSKSPFFRECLLVYRSYIITYFINLFLFTVLKWVGVNPYINQAICTVLMSFASYFLLRGSYNKPKAGADTIEE